MPVTKYRSVAEMPDSKRLVPLDPENLRVACDLTELAYGLHPWRLEAGVRKFASATEATEARQKARRAGAARPGSDGQRGGGAILDVALVGVEGIEDLQPQLEPLTSGYS